MVSVAIVRVKVHRTSLCPLMQMHILPMITRDHSLRENGQLLRNCLPLKQTGTRMEVTMKN
jgi:hypothetical protein